MSQDSRISLPISQNIALGQPAVPLAPNRSSTANKPRTKLGLRTVDRNDTLCNQSRSERTMRRSSNVKASFYLKDNPHSELYSRGKNDHRTNRPERLHS